MRRDAIINLIQGQARIYNEADERGRPVGRVQRIDALFLYERAGAITGAQFEAGQRFKHKCESIAAGIFARAGDGLPQGKQSLTPRHPNEHLLRNVEQIGNAIKGLGEPLSSLVISVCCHGHSAKRWAMKVMGMKERTAERKGIIQLRQALDKLQDFC